MSDYPRGGRGSGRGRGRGGGRGFLREVDGGRGRGRGRGPGRHRDLELRGLDSTELKSVFSGLKSDEKIDGDEYLARNKLQDPQITTTFPALNRNLESDQAAAMERSDIHHYVVPILVCAFAVLLFVRLLIQRG